MASEPNACREMSLTEKLDEMEKKLTEIELLSKENKEILFDTKNEVNKQEGRSVNCLEDVIDKANSTLDRIHEIQRYINFRLKGETK